jgi:hypothetical protein
MNIQMRIITDENVDQLMSMNYSDNANKLLHMNNDDLESAMRTFNITTKRALDNSINTKNKTPNNLNTFFIMRLFFKMSQIYTIINSFPYKLPLR